MSVLDEVFASLEAMNPLQLLLAFIGCIAYAFAQGGLLPLRGRRVAWFAAAAAATGFAFSSADWTRATMLVSFALVGMGLFVATVWLTCRALGLRPPQPPVAAATAGNIADPAADADAAPRISRPGNPAHSV